ncbi:uncharacterized protein LOC117341237 [Pecten maximus]|uniref:uncharacterized protein LOC117341237 n=1 Tax=Pecten maximus TaxID=6579 RepID=UPI0014583518|nr:uncharacterized protein LOC117341237 [Pecten maximus]
MNVACSNLLRHVIVSTRKDISRRFQTFSPLKYQVKSIRATKAPSEDMLRVWGALRQDGQVRPSDMDTFNSLGKTTKGSKQLEIFRKRLKHEPVLMDRQPIFGDFMVAQVPSILKPAPTNFPITATKKMMRRLKTKHLQTKEDSINQLTFTV